MQSTSSVDVAITPKKRGRPAKVKPHQLSAETIETLKEVGADVKGLTPRNKKPDIQKEVVEIIREIIVEKEIVREVAPKVLEGFALWKALKEAGYPQGGGGNYWEAHDSFEKAYVARPEELYTHFLGDPIAWDKLRDCLARAWLELSLK